MLSVVTFSVVSTKSKAASSIIGVSVSEERFVRGLQRGQLLLVRFQGVPVTRRHPQRALSDVKHVIGRPHQRRAVVRARSRNAVVSGPPGSRLKAPIDRRRCGEETLTYRLYEHRIAHLRGFSEQAGGQIRLSVDGKQLVDFTYIALDEICYRLDTLRSDVLASVTKLKTESSIKGSIAIRKLA